MIEDDDNPMHNIGYGRGDDYVRAPLLKEKVDDDLHGEVLSVKEIVHCLIERNLQAWKALPEKIRDAMMDRPQDFQLIGNASNKNTKSGEFDYCILYSKTVWRYHPISLVWVISDIVR